MAGKTVKFSVIQEDIDSGVQGSMDDCPVALCMTRTLGVPVPVDGAENCSGCWIWIDHEHQENMVWPAPITVWDFVNTYDDSGPTAVQPFEFELQRLDLAGL